MAVNAEQSKCIFCDEFLQFVNAKSKWKEYESFFDDEGDFRCARCHAELLPDKKMFTCPNSTDDQHAMPLILCAACNLTIIQIQTRLSSPEALNREIDRLARSMILGTEQIETNRTYSDENEFELLIPERGAEEETPRCIILGATGVGKSTLLNKIAGCYYAYIEPEDSEGNLAELDDKPTLLKGMELFNAGYTDDMKAVTAFTSFSQVHFLGDSSRPLIVLDTPGSNDPDPERAQLQEIDLNTKLRKAGQVSTIMVVLSSEVLSSMRLDDNTMQQLRAIGEMFAPEDEKENDNFWGHVILLVSKCDEGDRKWKRGLARKIQSLQNNLRASLSTSATLPVYPVSSIQEDYQVETMAWSHADNFEQIWEFVSSSPPLVTDNVRVRRELRTIVAEKKQQRKILKAKCEIIQIWKRLVEKRKRREKKRHKNALEAADDVTEDPLTGLARGLMDIPRTVEYVYKDNAFVGVVGSPVSAVVGAGRGIFRIGEGIVRWPGRLIYGTQASQEEAYHEARMSTLKRGENAANQKIADFKNDIYQRQRELSDEMERLTRV